MKNAFSRMGLKCASMVFGGVLMAGALLAGSVNQISVTLPHDVAVGSTVLPSGHYTISGYEMGGEEYFLVRGDHGSAVTLPAQAVQTGESTKTEVIFSNDGNVWHFEKLLISGQTGYHFLGGK
jgi:hypothetical protein